MSFVIETESLGALTIPPEMLLEPAAHKKYRVEQHGESVQITFIPEIVVIQTLMTKECKSGTPCQSASALLGHRMCRG